MASLTIVPGIQPHLTNLGGRPRLSSVEPSFTGLQIRELREDRGWTLRQLSDITEELTGTRISPQSINAIELGASQNPSRRLLRPIAKAFGVSISSLFEDEEEPAGVGR